MKLRKKRGFTIVEMLMVIAVLAVLTGIVATAATSVIRKSRVRKNEALRVALQAGIATYYQQEGYWPPDRSGKLQEWSRDGLDSSAKNRKWSDGERVANLESDEYDELVRHLVDRKAALFPPLHLCPPLIHSPLTPTSSPSPRPSCRRRLNALGSHRARSRRRRPRTRRWLPHEP